MTAIIEHLDRQIEQARRERIVTLGPGRGCLRTHGRWIEATGSRYSADRSALDSRCDVQAAQLALLGAADRSASAPDVGPTRR